jgi:4-carboxymuconolactone decarboxylase
MNTSTNTTMPVSDKQLSLLCTTIACAIAQPQNNRAASEKALLHGIPYRYVYEVLLQTYLFAGFPVALDALTDLDAVARPMGYIPPHKEHHSPLYFWDRGEELCRQIYGSAYEKMRERLHSITPDLEQWMILEGYGKTLSREEVPIVVRELCIVTALTVLHRTTQLQSHIRGAVRVGATEEQCRIAINAATSVLSAEQAATTRAIAETILEKYLS